MMQKCHRCGNPATAGPNPMFPERWRCIPCSSLTSVTMPPNMERTAQVPPSISSGPAWTLAEGVARDTSIWEHQAEALRELEQGNNLTIATSTASGKSLIFQLWTMHVRESTEKKATTLVFYPTKALANDQARRWQECCRTMGLGPETVGQIDGDVPMVQRDRVMQNAGIVIATPDVCHAWLLRRAGTDANIRNFLRRLAVIIIDEAHVYETVFGSNSAYLFRRVTTAALQSGAEQRPRFIAATATIREPGKHLETLTGEKFSVIEESRNGAPRHQRDLYHLALNPRGGEPENQLALLMTHIIDTDPEAQVIAFRDSRMGVERIVQKIGRPESVLPYRSGYLARDRRNIEDKLRDNTIRGIVATSALELGIDMPDLNYGIQLDLPPSRKQFHQRLGRVGRSKPGTFVLLAPGDRFETYGETLMEYCENSVEPSLLYLDNEYINYQQALCLKDEMEGSRRDSRALPEHTRWPQGFDEALRNAHGRTPAHLRPIQDQRDNAPPQIANSLRSSGEETLDIIVGNDDGNGNRTMGHINLKSALDEAYPGAIYHHRGDSFRIEAWGRERETRKPFIRTRKLEKTGQRTKPLQMQTATIPLDPSGIIRKRSMNLGQLEERRITITESVEGYINADGKTRMYRYESEKDPRMSRKQREIPTTAVLLRIEEPWFKGETGPPWQARNQIASALRLHLAYQRSIALPDLGYQVNNIVQETDRGFAEMDDCILVHDNIHGGMGLVEHLYENMLQYARKLKVSTDNEPGAVYPEYVRALVRWLEMEEGNGTPGQAQRHGPGNWWRVIRQGNEVRVFSHQEQDNVRGRVEGYRWQDQVLHVIQSGDETILARDQQISPNGTSLDWQLWQPETGRTQDMQLMRR